jgi:hypothetical protein
MPTLHIYQSVVAENEQLRSDIKSLVSMLKEQKMAVAGLTKDREVLVSLIDSYTREIEDLKTDKFVQKMQTDVLGTTDGHKWAEEFCRLNPIADKGYMTAWFCNAIEIGREAGNKELNKEVAKTLFDFGAYITTRSPSVTLGSSSNAGPMIDLIRGYAEKRGINIDVDVWQE